MDVLLNEFQQNLQSVIREFCLKELAPLADNIEKSGVVPPEIIRRMSELGIFGMPFDESYGGQGKGYLATTLVLEELARVSGGVAMVAGINYLTGVPISLYGTEEQKINFLTPLCQGKAIGSFAFTEAATGSDPKAITTEASLDGNEYVINGQKRFVTAADLDGIIVLSAFDGSGISAFIAEKNRKGYQVTYNWEKLGMHGISLVDIKLEDYRIPSGNLLGQKGNGYALLLDTIAIGKLNTCGIILGCAQSALDEAIKYARERKVRGRPIAENQMIQSLLADVCVKVSAARWMTYRLAALADSGQDIRVESALTKIFVTEAATEAVHKAFRIHGAYAYVTDYRIERVLRDVYLGEIVEGSNEIQRTIVATSMLREAG